VNPLPHHLASAAPASRFFFLAARFLVSPPFVLFLRHRFPCLPALACNGSASVNRSVRPLALASFNSDAICSERVSQWRAASTERGRGAPTWIVPPASDREPNPPYRYIVSFVRLHERGFNVPASHFVRGLC
jgi:hypothetical protein